MHNGYIAVYSKITIFCISCFFVLRGHGCFHLPEFCYLVLLCWNIYTYTMLMGFFGFTSYVTENTHRLCYKEKFFRHLSLPNREVSLLTWVVTIRNHSTRVWQHRQPRQPGCDSITKPYKDLRYIYIYIHTYIYTNSGDRGSTAVQVLCYK